MTKFRMALAILFLTLLVPLGVAVVNAAVDLESFTGSWSGSRVTLQFATGSEVDHAAFHVWRSTSDINPDSVSSSNATRLTTSPILGDNACSGGGGGDYDYEDANLGSVTTYYYFLESLPCGSGSSAFYGALNDPDSGLRLTSPNAPPTNTPPANATSTNTPPAGSTAVPTSQATTAPGQPTNTPGPTGTLVPQATTGAPSATPRPTNTAGAAATSAPQATSAATSAPQPTAPTNAPQPTRAIPTTAPVESQATVPSQPQTVPTTAPVDSGEPAVATVVVEVIPTTTQGAVAAAVSPVVDGVAPSGDMTSNQPAPTPTLGGGLAVAPQGTGIDSVPADPIVATSSDGDGVDGLIQGLIAVILVGVVGLVGFIGWNYVRNR